MLQLKLVDAGLVLDEAVGKGRPDLKLEHELIVRKFVLGIK